jgi:hypothetical protein
MQQSHLTGAPSNQALEASTTPIVPGQGAPFVLARRLYPILTGGSRLSLADQVSGLTGDGVRFLNGFVSPLVIAAKPMRDSYMNQRGRLSNWI